MIGMSAKGQIGTSKADIAMVDEAMSAKGALKPSAQKTLANTSELIFRDGCVPAFNIRAVVELCSILGIHCNRDRHTSARKSHRPTAAGHSNCRTHTSRRHRNGVPPASRPCTPRPE